MGPSALSPDLSAEPAEGRHTHHWRDGAWIAPLFTLILSSALLVTEREWIAGSLAFVLIIVTVAYQLSVDPGDRRTTTTHPELALLGLAGVILFTPNVPHLPIFCFIGTFGLCAWYLFEGIQERNWQPLLATTLFFGSLAFTRYAGQESAFPDLIVPLASVALLFWAVVDCLVNEIPVNGP